MWTRKTSSTGKRFKSYEIPYHGHGLLPWQAGFGVFVCGILAIRWPMAATTMAVAAYACHRLLSRGRLTLSIAILAFAMGWAWGSYRLPPFPDHSPFSGGIKAVVSGVVDKIRSMPDQRLRIILKDVETADGDKARQVEGKMVWNWIDPPGPWPVPGQEITAPLRIYAIRGFQNDGGWDSIEYWRCKGVFYKAWARGPISGLKTGPPPGGTLQRMRRAFREALFPVAESGNQGAALLCALAIGDRYFLDRATTDLMRDAGLAHALALSGLHIGFVAGLGLALAWLAGLCGPGIFLRISRPKLAVLLAAPLVACYVWLGGATPSLLRASAMFASWGFLLLLGRGRVLMDGLFMALALIVVLNPLSVFDMSLQFSAVAVAGIALCMPWCQRLTRALGPLRPALGWLVYTLGTSVAATLALMPLTIWYFGQVHPNILLNALWIPALGLLAMPLGMSGALLGTMPWAHAPATALLNSCASIFDVLLRITRYVQELGLLPSHVVTRPLWPEILGYALATVALFAILAGRDENRKPVAAITAFALGLMAFSWFMAARPIANWDLKLSVLDVGQGQSVVLSTRGGKRWVLDAGGPFTPGFDAGRAIIGPWLQLGTPPRIDGMVLSHWDKDHVSGAGHLIDMFSIGRIVLPAASRKPTPGWIGRKLDSCEGSMKRAESGETIDLGDGVVMEILHPTASFAIKENSNDSSTVVRIVRHGRGVALIPGDIEKGGLRALLDSGKDLRADVLVLPHHGSASSLSRELYETVSPTLAIASSGTSAYRSFPSPKVVKALEDEAIPLYRTNRSGQIDITWDNSQPPEIHTYKQR